MAIYGKVGESGQYIDPPQAVIRREGLVLMTAESPSVEHVAQADRSWLIPEERLEELYAAELATLDPMLAHILRHERNGEPERAARAESEFEIRQAEILEQYGRGETVYITETGECYHTTDGCTALANATSITGIKKSEGLKSYKPCSVCCKKLIN